MAVTPGAGRAAVFLDKDGTLVHDVAYNVDPEQIRLTVGAGPALRRLHRAGYLLVVVSNQSGVARGYFPEEALAAVQERLRGLLGEEGVALSGFYYCPHHPAGTVQPFARACLCRKPAPGMLRSAARDLDLDLSRSWLVGDILDDVEAGRAAGCRTVLVDNGNETQWVLTPARAPHALAGDLEQATEAILGARPAQPGPQAVLERR